MHFSVFINFHYLGSSLTVNQTSSSNNGRSKGKEEESAVDVISLIVPNTADSSKRGGEESAADVISLKVPDISSDSSDYLVTTYNSVTGYETSV